MYPVKTNKIQNTLLAGIGLIYIMLSEMGNMYVKLYAGHKFGDIWWHYSLTGPHPGPSLCLLDVRLKIIIMEPIGSYQFGPPSWSPSSGDKMHSHLA